MLDSEDLRNIKEMLDSSILASESRIKSELKDVLASKKDLAEVKKDIEELSNSVADAITTSNEANWETLQDHEKRISRLEAKAA